MHFAMPPRKTSRPPPYAARQSRGGLSIPPFLRNMRRRDRLRVVVIAILGFLTLAWLFGRIGGGGNSSVLPAAPPIGSGPPVVIVTTIDPKADPAWVQKIKSNREDYAKRHGAWSWAIREPHLHVSTNLDANRYSVKATLLSSPAPISTRCANPLPRGPRSPPFGTQ
jgi:hypothetical protein